MLSGINRWRGETIPDVTGTAKLTLAVTLLPRQEHLVWAKLPAASPLSEGSAILIKPCKAHTHKKNIIVCKSVSSISGNKWIPVRILNTSDKPLTLKHNTKVADMSPCTAVEDLDVNAGHTPAKKPKLQSQTTV